jgi:hypothetical protein
MTNRRLIAMIRGRALAGEPVVSAPLAARPQIVSALSRCTIAVGAAGVAVVLASGLGGGLISAAAGAAAGQGGLSGSGRPAADAVSGMAASAPVEGEVQGIGGGGTHTSVPAPMATPALQGIVAPSSTPAPNPAPRSARAVVAAPVVVVAPPAPGTVEAIILEVFGAHGREAIGVASCESHLHPTSVSRGGGNWGLFQINRAHAQRVANMGYRWEDLLDARVNALVAKSIFDEQGWRPWACRGAAR